MTRPEAAEVLRRDALEVIRTGDCSRANGRRLGVDSRTLRNIVMGTGWKHIPRVEVKEDAT